MKKAMAILVLLLLGLATLCTIYRLRNPQKTETELFFDVFNGNMFRKADKI